MTEEIDYPSASKSTSKEVIKPKQVKVVSGEVTQRKKGLGSKIAETFTGDNAHNVMEYVLFDVIIPAAKNMAADAVSQGFERLLFGEAKSRSRSRSSGSYTSYSKQYKSEDKPSRSISRAARASHNFAEVTIEHRDEAEDVLVKMTDLVKDYGSASVADLYDLVDITSNFTDNKWGWTDLSGADIERTRAGYLLDLPRPKPLE